MKRLKHEEDGEDVPRDREDVCVIHCVDSSSENFIHLTEERLVKLQEIAKKRLLEPASSSKRMSDVCSQVPEVMLRHHGYHRDCYQRFTMNLSRLAATASSRDSSKTAKNTCRPRRRSSEGTERFLFTPDCIFCNKPGRKKIKQGGSWTTEPISKFEFNGGKHVLEVAESKADADLLRRIKGYDLFASEACYHKSCRVKYIQDPVYWRSESFEAKRQQEDMQTAHAIAFSSVCATVDAQIIQKNGVLQLKYLRDEYVDNIKKTDFPNPNYRGENLKFKLVHQYADALSFVSLGQFGTSLVYSTAVDKSEAVRYAYILGTTDKTRDVAISLRASVLTRFKEAEQLRWPPTARYLEDLEDMTPPDLHRFLKMLLRGPQEDEPSAKVSRLISSIGQDVCRAVTNGHWKLPKHIMLCMALRHMFRSAELTTLLNRFGHSESYSFSLELETALAQMLQHSAALLPLQIIRNPPAPSTFHSDFDNFDQNTASGSIHTSNGIMLQEVGPSRDVLEGEEGEIETNTLEPDLSQRSRSTDRSWTIESSEHLPDCYVTQKKSPPFDVRTWVCVDGQAAQKRADTQNILWILARLHSASKGQEVSGWSGHISKTGDTPQKKTTIDYYPVINCPITEYRAVQECLRYSEEASKEVGQKYVITTFDLGVCMKAYPLMWVTPDKYKYHIVMIGSFHVICAYFKMVGKKMAGTGLADLRTESGLIGPNIIVCCIFSITLCDMY